ncbi:MAG: ABC transporter permease [Clostridiales bacterium]|nr:ABC transporter permease [Clostridiales bacterium]MCF8021499.1 ABC transporter permease [Clostridiales bacterium]
MKRHAVAVSNYITAFIIIISLNFLLPRLMPGNPLQAIYGEEALIAMTPELKAELISRFGLDKSLCEQFFNYLMNLCQGDLGYSYYYNAPVFEVILGALPWTILLVGAALVLSTTLGAVLGVEAGWRRGRAGDKVLLAGLMVLNGFPDFFIGMLLLLIFGVMLNILPLSGAVSPYANLTGVALLWDIFKHLLLPLSALTLAGITGSFLLTRNTMIGVLRSPFVLTARAKGLSPAAIRYRHAGRNSLLPVVTRAGVMAGRMATGVLFVEMVFSYPGLGHLVNTALTARDYPVLQGVFLVITVSVLTINLFTDILYTRLDPRVSYAY